MNSQLDVMKMHGKTFFWATWFLEKNIAERLYAIYAFCRRIDDLVDESDNEITLSKHLYEIINAWEKNEYHKAFCEFKSISRKYLPREDIIKEFLKGQASDLQHNQPENINELITYSYRVAGVVGLMVCDSIGIKDKNLKFFAIDLGIAMQLTNICRDIKEDAERGRIYLPKNMLRGIGLSDILQPTKQQLIIINDVRDSILKEADIYYESGYYGIEHLPKKTARSIRIAAKLYQEIGKKILKNNILFCDERVYLKKLEKVQISIKTIFFHRKKQIIINHNKLLHQAIKNLPDTNNK